MGGVGGWVVVGSGGGGGGGVRGGGSCCNYHCVGVGRFFDRQGTKSKKELSVTTDRTERARQLTSPCLRSLPSGSRPGQLADRIYYHEHQHTGSDTLAELTLPDVHYCSLLQFLLI